MPITTNTFTVGGVEFEGTDLVQSQIDHETSPANAVGLEGFGPPYSVSWDPTPNVTIELSLDLTSQLSYLSSAEISALTTIQLTNVELRGCVNNGAELEQFGQQVIRNLTVGEADIGTIRYVGPNVGNSGITGDTNLSHSDPTETYTTAIIFEGIAGNQTGVQAFLNNNTSNAVTSPTSVIINNGIVDISYLRGEGILRSYQAFTQHNYGDYIPSMNPNTYGIRLTFQHEYGEAETLEPTIVGDDTVTEGDSETYSVTLGGTATGEATYSWSITGGTITSGQDTSTITVNWTTPGSGNVSVSVTRQDVTATDIHDVTIESIPDPTPIPDPTLTATISGNNTVTEDDSETYSVTLGGTATGAAVYSWSVTGGTITSGQDTSTITVNWTTPGSGNVNITVTRQGISALGGFPVSVSSAIEETPIEETPTEETSGNWKKIITEESNAELTTLTTNQSLTVNGDLFVNLEEPPTPSDNFKVVVINPSNDLLFITSSGYGGGSTSTQIQVKLDNEDESVDYEPLQNIVINNYESNIDIDTSGGTLNMDF